MSVERLNLLRLFEKLSGTIVMRTLMLRDACKTHSVSRTLSPSGLLSAMGPWGAWGLRALQLEICTMFCYLRKIGNLFPLRVLMCGLKLECRRGRRWLQRHRRRRGAGAACSVASSTPSSATSR